MLAHIPSFGRNLRGLQDFLAYCVPKAYQRRVSWYLGSKVLAFRTLRLESQCSAGLRMQPYPRALYLLWPCHLHGTGCFGVRAVDTGFLTVVWRACLGSGLVLPWLLLFCDFGLARAPVGVSACPLPVLAGACGFIGWVWVAPVSRPFRLGFGACVFGRGLRVWWWV